MSNLHAQILECIEVKKGDKEFALHHLDGEWRAGIGTVSHDNLLGTPQFASGWCMEPEQAVTELFDLLVEYGGQVPAGQRSVTI